VLIQKPRLSDIKTAHLMQNLHATDTKTAVAFSREKLLIASSTVESTFAVKTDFRRRSQVPTKKNF
jgi:hypothetical protein